MEKPVRVSSVDLSEVIDLVSAAFKYPEGEKISRDFPLFFSAKNADHLFAIFENTEEGKVLASHAGNYQTTLFSEEDEFKVGGIGGVATDERYQGKGYSRAVIESCLDDLRQNDCDLAFLWSGEHSFFRKFGFELVGAQWSIEIPPDSGEKFNQIIERLEDENSATVFSKIEILEGARHIYNDGFDLYKSHSLRLGRSEDEFKTLIDSKGCRVLSAHSGGKLISYAILGKGIDLPGHLHEWAGEELGLLKILHLLASTESESVTVLSPQFTPKEASWIYALEEAGFRCSLGFMSMVKVLNFDRVRDILMKRVERLAMEPSFVRLERMDDGNITVGWATDPDIKLTEPEFLRFVFGPKLPSEQIPLANDSAAAFDSLLPIRLWWWGMDSV